MKRNRSSKWFERKKFAYFFLLYTPAVWFIYFKFGFAADLCYIVAGIYIPFIPYIVDWLADKF